MNDRDSTASDTPSIERRSAADTFKLLANETRISILRALSDSREGQPFSELFDSVPSEDTGNFNYHLNRLMGSFVKKTVDVYELTHAGRMAVGAIFASTYTADVSIEPLPMDWECLQCDGTFVIEGTGTRAHIRCDSCGSGSSISIPPGALQSISRDELSTVLIEWYRAQLQCIRAGFCRVCTGQTDRRLVEGVDPDADDPTPSKVRFECQQCGACASISGATLATFHPVIEGFFREHGIDTTLQHPTQMWRELERSRVQTVSRDPLAVEVVFSIDDEIVSARINAHGTVENVRRDRLE